MLSRLELCVDRVEVALDSRQGLLRQAPVLVRHADAGGRQTELLDRLRQFVSGGVLVDRVDPRTVMLWTDGCRALLSALIALLAWTGVLPFWLLDTLVALSGLAGGLFAPAAQSIIPRLVAKDQLAAANALSQATPQVALLTATPAGGVLVALVGPTPALALNAASFAVAVAVLAALAIAPLGRNAPVGAMPSFRALGSFGLVPLSQVAAGVLAEAAGPATLFVATGVLMGAAALAGLLSPTLRQLD